MSAESRRLHPAPASFCVSACASRASLASGSRATLPRTRRARLHERHIRAQRGVWQAQQQRSSCMCSLRCDEVRTATARATATRASHSMPFVRQHAAIESAQPRDARSVTLAFLARTQVHYPAAANHAARPHSAGHLTTCSATVDRLRADADVHRQQDDRRLVSESSYVPRRATFLANLGSRPLPMFYVAIFRR